MSRIGKKPIQVPAGVTVTIDKDNTVTVKGPNGELNRKFRSEIAIEMNDNIINVKRSSDKPFYRALHGTTGALISNMVLGVTQGFSKKLVINEKTYKGEVKGNKVQFSLGFSHPVIVDIPKGIKVTIEKQIVSVSGIDKELVGQFAQKVRHLRKVDPYKAKGIIYAGEKIRRKAGKTIAAGAK
ncbi:MAG: 50S ribosomal protein L6 [Nitrospiraceae bacterium]|nr:50S ribosomal protein L6 [Nitrospiraceae bacterium]